MNGITINDKQYIFIATNEDYIIHCDKCDLTKDGHSLSCNALCATYIQMVSTGCYRLYTEEWTAT